jgi:hypothetical protein
MNKNTIRSHGDGYEDNCLMSCEPVYYDSVELVLLDYQEKEGSRFLWKFSKF